MVEINILASGSSGNAYLVSDGKTTLLLDCGLSWKEIQKRSGFKKIDAVLCTHQHMDHCKGVAEALRLGVTVYMPSDMFFTSKYAVPFAKGIFDQSTIVERGYVIRAFDLVHDVKNLGYCIDIGGSRIVYITDTMYCKYTFPGVTHWILECNNVKEIMEVNVANGTLNVSLRNRIVKNHMSIETVKDILAANDLSKTQEIYLVHLSNDNSDAERFGIEVAEITGKLVIVA